MAPRPATAVLRGGHRRRRARRRLPRPQLLQRGRVVAATDNEHAVATVVRRLAHCPGDPGGHHLFASLVAQRPAVITAQVDEVGVQAFVQAIAGVVLLEQVIPQCIAALDGQALAERAFVGVGAGFVGMVGAVGIAVFQRREGVVPRGQVDEAYLRAYFAPHHQCLPFRRMLGERGPRAVVGAVVGPMAVDRQRQAMVQVQLLQARVEVGRAFDQHEGRALAADARGHQPGAGRAVVAYADDVGLIDHGRRWRAS